MDQYMSEQEWIDIFGDNLVDILKEQRMTQRELARAMHVEEGTISSYIHKKKMISTKNLITMSYVLGVSVDELSFFGLPVH